MLVREKCCAILSIDLFYFIFFFLKHNKENVERKVAGAVMFYCRRGRCSWPWGEQQAEGKRVVTMGSVQEWRGQGHIQVAAAPLLINSCETLWDQWRGLLFG